MIVNTAAAGRNASGGGKRGGRRGLRPAESRGGVVGIIAGLEREKFCRS